MEIQKCVEVVNERIVKIVDPIFYLAFVPVSQSFEGTLKTTPVILHIEKAFSVFGMTFWPLLDP